MTYRSFVISALAAALLWSLDAGQTSWAQTWQWKDKNGNTVIADTPPPSVNKARVLGAAPKPYTEELPAAADEKAAADGAQNAGDNKKPANAKPQTVAEKEAAFQKRQEEKRKKDEENAKKEKEQRELQAACQRARNSLAGLRNSEQRFSRLNESGQAEVMDDAQRQGESERLEAYIAENCQGV